MANSQKSPRKIADPAKKVLTAGGTQIQGFLDFLRTQGVAGLAVGLLLGSAVSVLANSLINNVIMPPIGLLLGSGEGIKGLMWQIGKASDGEIATIYYGTFLNDLINFVVIALVVYLVFNLLGLSKLDKKKQ